MDREDWVARLRAGETAAVAEIWEHFGDDLRRRARTRLRQYGITHEAESMDICNAVMMDLVKQGQVPLNQPQEMVHYMLRAIDNQVKDAFRQLSRQRRDFRRTDKQPVEYHGVADQQSSPSMHLFRREIFSRIAEQLPESDRPMIQWVLENYGWDEIGVRLGIEPDTARMRFQRAVRRVRDQMLRRDLND